MYHLTQFGVALPPGQARIEAGTGAITGDNVPLPGGGVYDAIGTAQAGRATTRLRLLCELMGEDAADLKSQFNALRQQIGLRRALHRRWDCDEEATEWTWARLEEIRAETQPRLPLWLPVELRFLLLAPYWRGAEQSEEFIGSSGDITLANSGNITVTHLKITVTGITTMSSGIILTNSTLGGAGWAWEEVVDVGDVLVVDTDSKSVTLNGVAAYDAFHLLGDNAAWLPLAPSGNVIEIDTGAGSASVLLEWHDGWV